MWVLVNRTNIKCFNLFHKNTFNGDENDGENSEYEDCDDSDSDKMFQEEFRLHKRDYYTNKLEYKNVTKYVFFVVHYIF